VHDARLDDRLRKDRLDGLGEALQAIAAGNQDVLDAAVFQLADHLDDQRQLLLQVDDN
jgi:hypothetical protein